MNNSFNICILGDSHLWPIRNAVSNGAEFPGVVHVHFAGAAGMGLYSLIADGHSIRLPGGDYRNLRGFDENGVLNVEDFSAFVIVGLGSSIRASLPLYSRWRTVGMEAPAPISLVSEPCFHTALSGIIKRRGALRVASCLREASQSPIFIVPDPYPVREVSVSDKAWQISVSDQLLLKDMYWRVLNNSLPAATTVLMQPKETLDGHIFTNEEYSSNVKKDDPEKREYYHMNALYGDIIFDQVSGIISHYQRSLKY